MIDEIVNGLIQQNKQLIESLNTHAGAIKALSERITVLEAEMINMRKKTYDTHSTGTPAVQQTRAGQHLNSLGVLGGL
jgi:predicted  nucleic acid-binding Zn-ribbon protein